MLITRPSITGVDASRTAGDVTIESIARVRRSPNSGVRHGRMDVMEGTMSSDSFHYTIYIDTTPKRLWRALTDPTKTKKWWNVSFVTDWKVGSTMDVKMGHLTIRDPEQVVLESTSPSRLAYTWHTFTPAWASANGYSEEDRLKFANETRSKVTFDIDRAQRRGPAVVDPRRLRRRQSGARGDSRRVAGPSLEPQDVPRTRRAARLFDVAVTSTPSSR